MIRTAYHPEADAMFVWVGAHDANSVTQEVAPGIMLDFDIESRA